ncbi:CopG family ribbon-helix-helix protein [Rhizobium phage RHph_TM3_3_9]|nr:CopG family ribbon-helix-helix protein [Rhizobium phage RHph_TM3_3_9]QIG68596.1 CopG family ribbon-helix-helix protein [Rhizobium phage RHph_TM3_3_13]QIG74454.1 CopG family ribbon-helix-helix protein [Rhizobium phage RHph_TM3_3_10]QXV74568.1 CopG family ribbon-helix-helix protein [Rhizobium phage RHEph19]
MKTMTLNLSDDEMKVLNDLAKSKEMTKTAVMRQALRTYQAVDRFGDFMLWDGKPPLDRPQR